MKNDPLSQHPFLSFLAISIGVLAVCAFLPLPLPLLAFVPILLVLTGMLFLKQGAHIAGPMGFFATLVIAFTQFGATPSILFYSQWKGMNLTLFVLSILFPALALFKVVDHAGGIGRIGSALRSLIPDRGLAWLVIAVAFSAIMEGVAGFGLPIAVSAPIMIGLGLDPLIAVASAAIGHAWSVAYGDMGAIVLTLHQLVETPAEDFAPILAFCFGLALLLTLFAVAKLQGGKVKVPSILLIGAGMIATQTLLVLNGMAAISDLVVGVVGIGIASIISRRRQAEKTQIYLDRPLRSALVSYGGIAVLLFLISSVPPITAFLSRVVWRFEFPALTTTIGYTAKPSAQEYFPLMSTGLLSILVAYVSHLLNRKWKLIGEDVKFRGVLKETALITWRTMIGITFMVGMSMLMDTAGLSTRMAEVISNGLGVVTPVISPFIGSLGAFASGSANSSNMLFISMQENMARLLAFAPAILISTQVTGAALGSMVAPAKIMVGAATSEVKGHEGDVIRITLPYLLIIDLFVGLAAFAIILLS